MASPCKQCKYDDNRGGCNARKASTEKGCACNNWRFCPEQESSIWGVGCAAWGCEYRNRDIPESWGRKRPWALG